jgi:hypothetical protein
MRIQGHGNIHVGCGGSVFLMGMGMQVRQRWGVKIGATGGTRGGLTHIFSYLVSVSAIRMMAVVMTPIITRAATIQIAIFASIIIVRP